METDTLRVFTFLIGMIAILGVGWWTFSPSRRQRFRDAAQLPFDDEDASRHAAAVAELRGEKNNEQKEKTEA